MLLGCGCSSALRGLYGVGAFIRPDYQVLGACDANGTGPTGNLKATWMWMKGPDGKMACYAPNDPKILQQDTTQVFTSAPELPVTKTPTLPPPGGTVALPLPSTFDPIAFAKDNWMWIAGGVGAIVLFSQMK